jgi:hypothetical protein
MKMITSTQIKDLRFISDDYELTEKIKKILAELRLVRDPFFLTLSEFDMILRWKLRQQYGRQQSIRSFNTDEIIRQVTGLALSILHTDNEYELELRIKILCSLRGVEIPIASAVLALTFPNQFAVIDYRGWRQIFGNKPYSCTINNYKTYMREIRRLSEELGWPVQEVDLAIWEYDRRNS